MTTWVHRALLVPPSLVGLARGLASGLEPISAAGMFTTAAYNASGEVVYYVSNGLIGEDFAYLLSDPVLLHQAAGMVDSTVTLAQCRALITYSIIDAERPALSIIEELGLRLSPPVALPGP